MNSRKVVFLLVWTLIVLLLFSVLIYRGCTADAGKSAPIDENSINTAENNDESSNDTESSDDEVPSSAPADKNPADLEERELPEEPIIKDKNTVVDSEGFLHGKIIPNKGFEEALLKLPGVNLSHTMEIINGIREYVDLSQIKAGEDFKVKLSKDGKVDEFVYYPDIITFHILKRDPADGKLKYTSKIMPTEKRYRIIEGEVNTTLNQALIDREDVTRNIRAVTNGILECIVSFNTDARKGDKFRILVEEKFYKGKPVPGAKIIYASYDGKRAGFHEAFRFEDTDPKSAFNAHYTKEGKALIPSAMRLPIDRVHVTSPFGMRRHPVTGGLVFHNGVDYGGSVGSSVYSVAPGKVVDVKVTAYGGKQITICHSDGTETYYLHLNSFLVKRGAKVGARQRIGTVGCTGRVTGPHLHFGIKSLKGEWLNPLKKRMIATPQLGGERFTMFKRQIKDINKLLDDTEKYQDWLKKYDEGPQPEGFYEEYKL